MNKFAFFSNLIVTNFAIKFFFLVSTVLGLLVACNTSPNSSKPPIPQTQPAPTVIVDPNLKPPVSNLPGFSVDETRPIASVTGLDNTQATFVENELWLSTDNKSELDALLNRVQGEVLLTFNPEDYGLSGTESQYLVRVNLPSTDTSTLSENLRKLDPNVTGDHRVSSQAGLNLLAVSADEANNGMRIGLNWVGGGAQFRDKDALEAPSGPSLASVSYNQNAFAWPSHNVGSIQDIGVAESWRALELAGKLSNKVKIAILDMGFAPDADFPDSRLAISNVPLVNPIGTENLLDCGGPCPWHGTNVLSAAMAVPDNKYGSAGSAGSVADAVIVFTLYDFFTSITALGEARLAGAKIANMSYGAPVPDYLFFTVLPFEAATALFRTSGMLIFAAAGNDGTNVDAERCFFGVCWEKTWHTPCENAGVICVGGISGNSKLKAGGSNFGKEQVDIFAPFTLWLGPDPDSPNNLVQVKNGTSFSSPFTAGIAALIWAANPSLSAGQVEDLLLDTAHSSPDDKVNLYVNALGAVQKALGNIPPSIKLFGHEDGDEFERQLNQPVGLSASVIDFEDGNNCCALEWVSDIDGDLGVGSSIQPIFTSIGSRSITASTQDSNGAISRVSVTVNIVNTPPRVEITTPASGTEIFRNTPFILRATSFDINEPDVQLACDRLTWSSSILSDSFQASGCEVEVSFASNGIRTLTLTGTDSQGATGTATVDINIVDPPINLPPSVRVTSPENNQDVGTNETLILAGTATDPEGDEPLSFEWTAKLNDTAPTIIGNAPSIEWKPSDTVDFSGEGRYVIELRLSVTDSQDNTGSDFVLLEFIIIN